MGSRSTSIPSLAAGCSEEEVFERIHQATGRKLAPTAEHLMRATPRQWLGRMLNNLQAVFASTGRERDMYAMQEMQGLL